MFHPTLDNIALNHLHFIVPNYMNEVYAEIGITQALEEFGCTSALLTEVYMRKNKCITKEKFEEMYKTEEENETRMDLSVEEDLENFIQRIKNGEINKDTIPKRGDWKDSFLLCLLDKEERKKLEEKDEDFMETFQLGEEADVPEAEWNVSESNLKFSRSVCIRDTYYIDTSKTTKL